MAGMYVCMYHIYLRLLRFSLLCSLSTHREAVASCLPIQNVFCSLRHRTTSWDIVGHGTPTPACSAPFFTLPASRQKLALCSRTPSRRFASDLSGPTPLHVLPYSTSRSEASRAACANVAVWLVLTGLSAGSSEASLGVHANALSGRAGA